jgi:hypothetical protein
VLTESPRRPQQHLAARFMTKSRIASEGHVRDAIHNFNSDGFNALYPHHWGGRPPTFMLPQHQQIKKLALSRPQDHALPFSTWSLYKMADFIVAGRWSRHQP